MKKKSFKGILLVSDMDSTLLNGEKHISKADKIAISHFIECGGVFTIATGRREISVSEYVNTLGINAPVIVYNGAVIYDFRKNDILYISYLPESTKDILGKIINKFPSLAVIAYSINNAFCLRQNEIMMNFGVREDVTSAIMHINQLTEHLLKVTIAGENEELKRLKEYINKEVPSIHVVFTGRRFLELTGENTSKGNALMHLIDTLDIQKSDVIAIGDNMNDYEMLKEAGIGIAVENACSELKEIADFCGPNHNDSPVSKVIQWIGEGKI